MSSPFFKEVGVPRRGDLSQPKSLRQPLTKSSSPALPPSSPTSSLTSPPSSLPTRPDPSGSAQTRSSPHPSSPGRVPTTLATGLGTPPSTLAPKKTSPPALRRRLYTCAPGNLRGATPRPSHRWGGDGRKLWCQRPLNRGLDVLEITLDHLQPLPEPRRRAEMELLSPSLDQAGLFRRFMREFGAEDRVDFTDLAGNLLIIDRQLFLDLKGA
jgi:hypothetical protein